MTEQRQKRPDDINDILYDMCRELVRNGHRMADSDKRRLFRTIYTVWKERQANGEKLPRPDKYFARSRYGTVGIPEAHAWLMEIMDELMRRHKNGYGWGWH